MTRTATAALPLRADLEALPLCTLDKEMAQRGAPFCQITAPQAPPRQAPAARGGPARAGASGARTRGASTADERSEGAAALGRGGAGPGAQATGADRGGQPLPGQAGPARNKGPPRQAAFERTWPPRAPVCLPSRTVH